MKKILFVLLALMPVHAFAYKVVFNLKGNQSVAELGEGGSVTSDATIIWDEKKDGPIADASILGYAERYTDDNGKPALRENADLKAAKLAKDTAAANLEASQKQDFSDLKAIKDKFVAGTNTNADLVKALKILLKQKFNE